MLELLLWVIVIPVSVCSLRHLALSIVALIVYVAVISYRSCHNTLIDHVSWLVDQEHFLVLMLHARFAFTNR